MYSQWALPTLKNQLNNDKKKITCKKWPFLTNNFFSYRWGGKGSSSNPCSEIYRGSRAFSEPESRAVSVWKIYISSILLITLLIGKKCK